MLINMLKLYDYLEDMTAGNGRHWYYQNRLKYYMSDIMEELHISEEDAHISVKRACLACLQLDIPVDLNFKRTFSHDGNTLKADWKLSALACYLVIINADPANENVARAQLFFAMNTSR